MSDPEAVTERSPLLGRDHQERQIDAFAAQISKAQNGTAPNGSVQQNINDPDIERDDTQATDDDLETLRKAKSVKFILPVLAIGVWIVDSKHGRRA